MTFILVENVVLSFMLTQDYIAVNIIINKRKVELAEGLEAKIYEEAKKNNGFEVYD